MGPEVFLFHKRREMNKQVIILVAAIMFVLGMIFGLLVDIDKRVVDIDKRERKVVQTRTNYADDPVMLFETVGIKDCEYDAYEKGNKTGAVRLEREDLAEAVDVFKGEEFEKDIVSVLYINAPEASKERPRGQPALLPLGQKNGVFCSFGITGSYSMSPFVEFERKYQSKIQK